MMQGYNGSQLWDTGFMVQAILATNFEEEYGATLRKAHTFIKNSQVLFCPAIFFLLWYIHQTLHVLSNLISSYISLHQIFFT